jgi:hypothetical protein
MDNMDIGGAVNGGDKKSQMKCLFGTLHISLTKLLLCSSISKPLLQGWQYL